MKTTKYVLFVLYIFFISFILNQQDSNKMEPIIQKFLEYSQYDSEFIKNLTYTRKNKQKFLELTLNIELTKAFHSLSDEQKYWIIRNGYRRLHLKFNTIGSLNIRYKINAYDDENRYLYSYRNEENLYVNNAVIDSSILSPNYVNQLETIAKQKVSTGYSKQEVFDYFVRIHSVITVNGFYSNPSKDKAVILNAVKKHFQLSEEEIITVLKELYWL
ncbi:hypothetical protein [Bacillus sp. 1P06AnD]|uniref:hypothetical protein n=1 Tax=Bacillus sp. 1P06AnD TaxID=3132208 RepID=UPI0039A1F817